MERKPALTPREAGGINQPCYRIHNVVRAPGGNAAPADRRGEVARTVEFSNLPHDFAETLELVFVGITIVVSLAIMVAFGHWWQK